MKADLINESTNTGFLQTLGIALGNLKQQLQRDYERAYPDLREVIHLVLDEEESRAWDLTVFPHLLLPDLVEAHVAKLNLQPVETKHEDILAPRQYREIDFNQPVFALAG